MVFFDDNSSEIFFAKLTGFFSVNAGNLDWRFPVNLVKFLRVTSLQNTSERLLLNIANHTSYCYFLRNNSILFASNYFKLQKENCSILFFTRTRSTITLLSENTD